MSDQTRESIHIEASPERVYAVAVDFARYPEWATDVKEVEVLERDGDGRGTKVRFEIAALGRTIGYVLSYWYDDAPGGFSWELEKSDVITRLDGSYTFAADGDGTQVGYALAVDLTLPLPGFMKKAATGMIVQNAMKQLKRHVEAAGSPG